MKKPGSPLLLHLNRDLVKKPGFWVAPAPLHLCTPAPLLPGKIKQDYGVSLSHPSDKSMAETKIIIPESIQEALAEIALTTGKSEQQLIAEALSELIQNYQTRNRLALMRKARGMWADREDIPNLEELRQEWHLG